MPLKKIAIITFVIIISIILLAVFTTEEKTPVTDIKPEVIPVEEAVASDVVAVNPSVSENLTVASTYEEWKDPKTGLIWLKCPIGEELKNGFCDTAKLTGIHEKIRGVTGSLTEHTAEREFSYKQAQKVLVYLNSINFNGSSMWRLPTISELAELRQCPNGWDEQQEMIEIPKGNRTISVPFKCKYTENENGVFNVFNTISPRLETSGMGIWTSTSAGKDEYKTYKVWSSSVTTGHLGIVDAGEEEDFWQGVYINIYLVRDH